MFIDNLRIEVHDMLHKYQLSAIFREMAKEIDSMDNNFQTTIADDLRKMAKVIERLGHGQKTTYWLL